MGDDDFEIDPQNHVIFSKWSEDKKRQLENLGFDVSLVDCKPTSNTAKRMDFSNKIVAATICVWESGEVEFEALNRLTDEFIFADKAPEELPLEAKLDYYLERIIGN